MRGLGIEVLYLASAVLFILGLRGLSSPASARRGMFMAEIGMLLAIIGTLASGGFEGNGLVVIAVAIVIGSVIGAPMALIMPMTAVLGPP